jgi:HSP20 family protein
MPSGRDDTSMVEGSEWSPAVDIKEEEGRYLIHADIPGVKADEIEVSMEQGVLTIKGERQSENIEEKENYRRVERQSGQFYRRFNLPDSADADKIEEAMEACPVNCITWSEE